MKISPYTNVVNDALNLPFLCARQMMVEHIRRSTKQLNLRYKLTIGDPCLPLPVKKLRARAGHPFNVIARGSTCQIGALAVCNEFYYYGTPYYLPLFKFHAQQRTCIRDITKCHTSVQGEILSPGHMCQVASNLGLELETRYVFNKNSFVAAIKRSIDQGKPAIIAIQYFPDIQEDWAEHAITILGYDGPQNSLLVFDYDRLVEWDIDKTYERFNAVQKIRNRPIIYAKDPVVRDPGRWLNLDHAAHVNGAFYAYRRKIEAFTTRQFLINKDLIRTTLYPAQSFWGIFFTVSKKHQDATIAA